jgi:hypothetical protein
MDMEMALMEHGIPINWINFLDYFSFIVIDDNVILEGFIDLEQEVSMDNGNFLGSIGIFWLKFETEHNLLHFFINVGGSGASFGSGGRDGVICVGRVDQLSELRNG